jgi:DNA-binding MarR family transcriptional regulator
MQNGDLIIMNELAAQKDYDEILNSLIPKEFPRLIRLADAVNRYIDIRFRDEINWLEINALMTITRYKGNLNLSQLSVLMIRPKWTITKLIDSLQERGLVTRVHSGKDRRSYEIKITKDGLKKLDEKLTLFEKADKEIMHSITASEIEMLGKIHSMITRRLIEVTNKHNDSFLYYQRGVLYKNMQKKEAAISNFKYAREISKDDILLGKIRHELHELQD